MRERVPSTEVSPWGLGLAGSGRGLTPDLAKPLCLRSKEVFLECCLRLRKPEEAVQKALAGEEGSGGVRGSASKMESRLQMAGSGAFRSGGGEAGAEVGTQAPACRLRACGPSTPSFHLSSGSFCEEAEAEVGGQGAVWKG